MKRFGFVVVPEKGVNQQMSDGFQMEQGEYVPHADNIQIARNNACPAAMFYTTAANRDGEMNQYARRYPGVTFSPVELTTGISYQPSPKASEFKFSSQGKTPL